jgi:hypothetical protein
MLSFKSGTHGTAFVVRHSLDMRASSFVIDAVSVGFHRRKRTVA